MAESNTRRMQADPEREPQDLGQHVHRCSFAALVRLARPSSSRAAAVLLAGRLAALGVEAGLLRRLRGLRRAPRRFDLAARPPAARAAAPARPRGCGPATASPTRSRARPGRAVRAAVPLARRQRRRRRDREAHLDARVRRVGVLAARATRAGRAPLELVEADDARRVHAQNATFGDASCAVSAPPVSATVG